MKTVKFLTLGCKVNQYDTQSIRELFLKRGFQEVQENNKADFCVINTCTVTKDADQKCRLAIRNCIRDNPGSKVIVTGCLARSADLPEIKGIHYIISKNFFSDGITGFSGRTRAFLKIQDGCDNFCSYCKVPLVRGRARSRQFDELIEEASVLSAKGFKEIVLTGICLGSYGKDLPDCGDITDLIGELEKIGPLLRIRLSSIEAANVSDRLIRKMAVSKKMCRHLHIPLQSGDNRILRKMNRKYTRADYLRLIKKIRKNIPGIALTTDIMVGFPGETEENFKNTLDLVARMLPLRTHIFPYSPREGTYASKNFKDNIDPLIIKQRMKRLKALSDTCSLAYKKIFIGKKMDVLIESSAKGGIWCGYTGNYIKIGLRSGDCLKNEVVSARLKKIEKGLFIAEAA